MPRPDLLFTCPQVEISASRNLLLLAWHDAPTVGVMREVARAGRTMARQHPAGSGLLNLLLRGTPKFTDEVRDEVVKIDRDPSLFPLGIGRVIMLTGLTGLAVRVFLNTVTLLARNTTRPVQAFSNVQEAAAWLAPKLERGGQPWTTGEVIALAAPFLEPRQREERGAA